MSNFLLILQLRSDGGHNWKRRIDGLYYRHYVWDLNRAVKAANRQTFFQVQITE